MSGIVGHTLYGLLGLKAASNRLLPVAPIAGRHLASYLAGAYLGCDIQTMPEAVCVDTGREIGFGTVLIDKSPYTQGSVRPWSLQVGDKSYRPQQIHDLFYGRAHLVFGWTREQREHTVPWDHLPDYVANVVDDYYEMFGPGERPLAYLLGWIAHIVSDSLIKSVHPGIDLNLVDGKYTARNRPIQDLFMFHEIGVKELHLNWPALFADMAATPVEPVQRHYMRLATPRGRLPKDFPHGWQPDQADLIDAVLRENRRWCGQHADHVLSDMQLVADANGVLDCNEAIRSRTGYSYPQMVALAEQAHLRGACLQMGEAIAEMFVAVLRRSPRLANLPVDDGPSWTELMKSWSAK
jgi:hypothetical protein